MIYLMQYSMKKTIIPILLFFFGNFLYGQNNSSNKCYASCKTPDVYEDKLYETYIFTGDINKEKVNIKDVIVHTTPARSEWVKKKTAANCISNNPDDCLVWCLVEEPAEKKTLYILKDTTQTKNFFIQYNEVRELIKPSTGQEEREVLCSTKNKTLIKRIQSELSSLEFYEGPIDGKVDKSLKRALKDFQIENGIAYGDFTIESILILGIDIDSIENEKD